MSEIKLKQNCFVLVLFQLGYISAVTTSWKKHQPWRHNGVRSDQLENAVFYTLLINNSVWATKTFNNKFNTSTGELNKDRVPA